MPTLPVIHTSFGAGELSPFLYGRVDLAKFHVGARTMLNMLVHPHGGASNRPGTKFVAAVDDQTKRHRLFPFRFRSSPAGQNYILVFGDLTMQVAKDGGMVSLTTATITGITKANPGVVTTSAAHGFSSGTRVPIASVAGMTQVNGNTYTITVVDATHFSIGVNTSGYTTYTSGGTAGGGTFTLATPYAYTDLPTLKFVQSADTMTLTHPNFKPRTLTRTGHANWTIAPITFAPSTAKVTGLAAGASGTAAYIQVTAINDSTGEESLPCDAIGANSATAGAWTWTASSGCSAYNVYKRKGSIYGFVAQVSTPAWTDASIDPDIGVTPPQFRNPFSAGTIASVTVVSGGSGYTSPTVTAIDTTGSGATFSPTVSGGVITAVSVTNPGSKYSANVTMQVTEGTGSGATITLNMVSDGFNPIVGFEEWHVDSATVTNGGSGYHAGAYALVYNYDGGYPASPPTTLSLGISGGAIVSATVTLSGHGYMAPNFPYAVVYDAPGTPASLTAVLTDNEVGPQCSTYYQQRQTYAGTTVNPQTLWLSNVGAFFNMAVSSPTKDSDAITRTFVSREVNEIRHLVPMGTSMLAMTAGAEWRVYPGANTPAITPGTCVTLPQTNFGCNHVPPIVAGSALLFVQERGSRVRELQFDALSDQYKPRDMSVLASHLFTDTANQYDIEEWTWAEEPFRIAWAVRDDGIVLGFTYMNEHEVYAWHRHVMAASGSAAAVVESVASVPETDGSSLLDAVYFIVKRTINGGTKRYIERMVARQWSSNALAWFVDCGLSYSGVPVSSVSGLDHLEGESVAVLADGNVLTNKTVTAGAISLGASYSTVIAGLPYTADLESLNLEIAGSPTLQGQMKKISEVTARVKDTRSFKIGLSLTASNGLRTVSTVSSGVTQDYLTTIPSDWNTDGRLCIRQDLPLPITITALIPKVAMGA